MTDLSFYYLDGLVLALNHASYLVEIRRMKEDPPRFDRISDLPEWVFNSRLAIWITDEKASIYQRSMDGERIRKALMKERSAAATAMHS